MASSVLLQAASLTSASQPSITGNWTYGFAIKCNAGEYGNGTDNLIFAFGDGAGVEGAGVGVLGGANTTVQAFVFRATGGEFQPATLFTGSFTGWFFGLLRHTAGSPSYDVSTRLENVTTWTTVTLTLTTQMTVASSLFIGTDEFGENCANSDIRHFFCQAVRMSDAVALTATQNINVAPAGTNLHWLRLLNSATATTNGGTAANWTASGTLQTAASEPAESVGGVGDVPWAAAQRTMRNSLLRM